jgi:hypothetical protein
MVPAAASRPSMNPSSTSNLGSPATCLSCHAEDLTMTNAAVEAGANWRCRRCGQQWDAARLRTVTGYADWLFNHPSSAAVDHPPQRDNI